MKSAAKTTGLRYWLLRVLDECDRVAADFSADPVHDLRVALRRCRSMADGLLAIDPDPEWKAMKKAGKSLFQSLGALRDVQIMMDWIEKLQAARSDSVSPASDPQSANIGPSSTEHEKSDRHDVPHSAIHALLRVLADRERQHKQQAKSALDDFDRKQWKKWSSTLPKRAARFRLGSPLFKHLALERWTEARRLHDRALRNRSSVGLHQLRIGIKRFRYIVENFLPVEHEAWSNDLKTVQDLLGEIHDLDVLWTTALQCGVFRDDAEKKKWRSTIQGERARRIEKYRKHMVGPDSWWQVWRAALPQGKQIQEIATRRMKLWAAALDPDLPHSERVAGLALQLYDGLTNANLLPANGSGDERFALFVAALLHDVGKSKSEKNHHKASARIIVKRGAPLGWEPGLVSRAAAAARFHRGALPRRSHKELRDLLPDQQKQVTRLSAILRLANALDAKHDGRTRRLQIENSPVQMKSRRRTNGFLSKPPGIPRKEAVIIAVEGYLPTNSTARAVAAERYLLETVLRRPILVKPMTARPPRVQ